MAWRPTPYLIEGELDNTERRKVTGWMWFLGLDGHVTFDLEGEFHRDIRGTKIRFYGDAPDLPDTAEADAYMHGFASHHTGRVGNITAGLPPRDYVFYPYIELYSDQNGRVVVQPDPEQIEVIGTPIPSCESDPISREEQRRNIEEYLRQIREELRSESEPDNQRRRPPPIRPGDQPPMKE